MIIGLLSIEIYIPYSHSLKEKRRRIVKIKDRIKKRFNVAFSEVDYHQKWQRSKIGIVTLNRERTFIEKIFNKIITDIEDNLDGEILRKDISYF
jgi:uncharacterized protein YlxP (DUF503 family)